MGQQLRAEGEASIARKAGEADEELLAERLIHWADCAARATSNAPARAM